MENEGLSSLYNIQEFNVIGFLNTIINLKKLRNYVNEIVQFIIKEKPKVIITIDTKGFSLALAKSLKIAFKNYDFKCPLIILYLQQYGLMVNQIKKMERIFMKN